MIQFVTVIHVVVCALLVLTVLLQQGKKDGMGAAFGGGSQSVFGARGAETFLEKVTKFLAVIFMCTSLGLVYFSTKETSNSILNEKTATEAPASPATAAETAPATTVPAQTSTEAPKAEDAKTAAPAAPAAPAAKK